MADGTGRACYGYGDMPPLASIAEASMAPLGQRILWRAVPVGIATGLVGYLLLQLYVPVAQMLFRDLQVEKGDALGTIQGVTLFGLAGFVIAAALECVRKEKKKARV